MTLEDGGLSEVSQAQDDEHASAPPRGLRGSHTRRVCATWRVSVVRVTCLQFAKTVDLKCPPHAYN